MEREPHQQVRLYTLAAAIALPETKRMADEGNWVNPIADEPSVLVLTVFGTLAGPRIFPMPGKLDATR